MSDMENDIYVKLSTELASINTELKNLREAVSREEASGGRRGDKQETISVQVARIETELKHLTTSVSELKEEMTTTKNTSRAAVGTSATALVGLIGSIFGVRL